MKASSGSSRKPPQYGLASRLGRLRRRLAQLALRLVQRLTAWLAREPEPADDAAAMRRFADAPAAWRRVLAAADPSLLDDCRAWQSFRTSGWAAPGDLTPAPAVAVPAPAALPPADPARARPTPRMPLSTAKSLAAPPERRVERDRPAAAAAGAAAGVAATGGTAAVSSAVPPFRPRPRFFDRPDPQTARALPPDAMPAVAAGRQPAPSREAPADRPMRPGVGEVPMASASPARAEPAREGSADRPMSPGTSAMQKASAPPARSAPPRAAPDRVAPDDRPKLPGAGAVSVASASPARAAPAQVGTFPDQPVRDQPSWDHSSRAAPEWLMLDPAFPRAQAVTSGHALRLPPAGRRAEPLAPPPAAAPDRPQATELAGPPAVSGRRVAAVPPTTDAPAMLHASPWPTLPARRERADGGRPIGRGLIDDFAARGNSEARRGTWNG